MTQPTDAPAETTKKQANPPNELIDQAPRKRGQRRWTPAQKAERAAKIREIRPWAHSTGPRSEEGKARSSSNAYRHGLKSALSLRFRRLLREQGRFLQMINKSLANPRVSSYKPPHQGLWEVTPDSQDHWRAAPQTSFFNRSKPFGFPQGARSEVYEQYMSDEQRSGKAKGEDHKRRL